MRKLVAPLFILGALAFSGAVWSRLPEAAGRCCKTKSSSAERRAPWRLSSGTKTAISAARLRLHLSPEAENHCWFPACFWRPFTA